MLSKCTLRIYMNELLHLCIKRKEVVGVRSHIQEVPLTDLEYKGRKWVITFICRDTEVVCEYDKRETWEEILRLLDKHL